MLLKLNQFLSHYEATSQPYQSLRPLFITLPCRSAHCVFTAMLLRLLLITESLMLLSGGHYLLK
jgi:hypothetical protein